MNLGRVLAHGWPWPGIAVTVRGRLQPAQARGSERHRALRSRSTARARRWAAPIEVTYTWTIEPTAKKLGAGLSRVRPLPGLATT